MHRRPDGERQIGTTWESLIDRQIREAADEGAFDDLPYQGKPLPLDDDRAAGAWALAHRMLRDAGYAPPWIEADKTVRELLAARERLVARAAGARTNEKAQIRDDLRKVVDEINRAIGTLNSLAPTDRQHRRLLDLTGELARLDRPPGSDGGL